MPCCSIFMHIPAILYLRKKKIIKMLDKAQTKGLILIVF